MNMRLKLAAMLLPPLPRSLAIAFGKGSHSAYRARHDPNREKTQADQEAMAAAEAKRQRRAAKRAANNETHPQKTTTSK